jgi:hypothetical protein
MKEDEAKTIIRMIKGSVGGRADPSVEEVYLASLPPLDATLATQAVLTGRREWKWFPSWSEFREAYRIQERLREPVGEQRVQLPKSSKVPLWVRRWIAARYLFARFGREQDTRPFHEQREHVDPLTKEWMPDGEWNEEAEKVTDRDVWKAMRS